MCYVRLRLICVLCYVLCDMCVISGSLREVESECREDGSWSQVFFFDIVAFFSFTNTAGPRGFSDFFCFFFLQIQITKK